MALKSGGKLSIHSLSGQQGRHLFGKLGVHSQKSLTFYSDRLQKDIDMVELKEPGTLHTIITFQANTSSDIGGVTVDWISNNVYWTDQIYNCISMAAVEDVNSGIMRVIETGLDVPGNVKVYPPNSYLFWTDYGRYPKIERSDLLGNHRTVIEEHTLRPIALEVDYNTQNIYWVDAGNNVIVKSDFDGHNIQTFIQNSFVSTLIGISIYEDYMFGVSSSDNNLYIMTLSDRSYHSAILNIKQSYDVSTISGKVQPYQFSPCEAVRCSHFCVGRLNNTEAQCACPSGRHLVSDTQCSEKEDLVPPLYLFQVDSRLCSFDVRAPDIKSPSTTCYENLPGEFMAVDFQERNLYFSEDGSIIELNWSSKESTRIVNGNSRIGAISLNWLTNYIYWTNEDGNIMSATNDGTQIETVITSIEGLFGIAVNPFSGFIYWSCNGQTPYIGRVLNDGTNRSEFITDIKRPQNLVFDFTEKRLYWADSETNTIESVQEDGTGRNTIHVGSSQAVSFIVGISLYQDYVAWVDKSVTSPGIGWTLKNGLGEKYREYVPNIGNSIVLYGSYNQPPELENKPEDKPETVVTNPPYEPDRKSIAIKTAIWCLWGQTKNSKDQLYKVILLVAVVAVAVAVVIAVAGAIMYCKRPNRSQSETVFAYENAPSTPTYTDTADTIEEMHLIRCGTGTRNNGTTYML